MRQIVEIISGFFGDSRVVGSSIHNLGIGAIVIDFGAIIVHSGANVIDFGAIPIDSGAINVELGQIGVNRGHSACHFVPINKESSNFVDKWL